METFIYIIIGTAITLIVTLTPFIIVKLITKGHIKYKTSVSLTILFALLSLFIFSLLCFAGILEKVTIPPILLWTYVGNRIMTSTKSNKKNDKENQEIDINLSNEVQNYKTEENPYFFKNEDSLSTENYSSTPNIQNSTDKTLEKPKKQKSSNIKTKVLAATTTILALTTIALSVGMVIQNQEMSSIVEDYEERLDKSEDLNETYQNKISNYSKMVNTLQSDLNFYTSQVVFVCNNSPYYHKPHCEYFNSKSFKIYLKREANSLGYDYCPYCFDY